jgi:hypothetical protein
VAYSADCRDHHGGIHRTRDLANRGGMPLRSSWAATIKLRHYLPRSAPRAATIKPERGRDDQSETLRAFGRLQTSDNLLPRGAHLLWKFGGMVWDHEKKLKELALAAINRQRPYRPLKVVPHDPKRNPALTPKIKGWITSEIFLVGKTPEEMERLLGFDSRPGREYLAHGIDVFAFTRHIRSHEFKLGGAYTYLPGGRPWDGIDLQWPPGTGATQWQLIVEVDCTFLKTVPRGQTYY